MPHHNACRRLLAATSIVAAGWIGSNTALGVGGTDCFVVHPVPGCGEAGCESEICLHDVHCCVVAWDAFCVGYANLSCANRLGDLNGDDKIGGSDLACLLSRWGSPAGDLNGDSFTDSVDLGLLLGNWTL